MSQCCGKIPSQEDVQHILESIDNAIREQIDFTKSEQERHERAERDAERELELLHNDTQDAQTRDAERDLQKTIDEEKGHVAFWRTKNEKLEGVGTTEKATFVRSIAQQNMKTENGDHTFYDPRNFRSGIAFGDSPRKNHD